MGSPDLGRAVKDMSKSCVFDFPDRPIDSFPPNFPPGIPPVLYPYDPKDDWPPIPPEIIPTPGIDPHPNPTDIPPMAPPATAIDSRAFYVEDEEHVSDWGAGIFFAGANPYNINMGLGVAHIFLAQKFDAKSICGPILLTETGHALQPSTATIYCSSGVMVYIHDYPHGQRVAYFLYYAQWMNTGTNENFVAFAPCPISLAGGTGVPPNVIGTGFITLLAGTFPSFSFPGYPVAVNTATKVLQTGAGFLITGGAINDFVIGQ